GIAGYTPSSADAAHMAAITATTSTLGALSVGDATNGQFRQITGVAAGTEDSDAVNVAQLTAVADTASDEIDAAKTHYYSVNDNGVQGGNYNNDGATGDNALAAGIGAKASGDNSIAIGSAALASAQQGVAIGDTSKAGDNGVALGNKAQAIGTGATALGPLSTATGANSVATGTYATSGGSGAIAQGMFSTASGDNSLASGSLSSAAGQNSIALGYSASATSEGGVALGSSSVATTGAGISGYVPVGATAAQMAAITATTSTLGAVSVGDATNGQFRQITGVAAGTEDSDAVNVAQLDAVTATADAAGQGWDISAQGANSTNVAPGDSVDLANTDGNIKVSKATDSNNVNFDLASDLVIDNSVTIGDTVINGDSVTTNNLTVNGDTKLGDNFYIDNSGAHYDGPITEG
ncbi:Head domain of trimeric autotransporter adhesin, partial [Pseudomonas segetis]